MLANFLTCVWRHICRIISPFTGLAIAFFVSRWHGQLERRIGHQGIPYIFIEYFFIFKQSSKQQSSKHHSTSSHRIAKCTTDFGPRYLLHNPRPEITSCDNQYTLSTLTNQHTNLDCSPIRTILLSSSFKYFVPAYFLLPSFAHLLYCFWLPSHFISSSLRFSIFKLTHVPLHSHLMLFAVQLLTRPSIIYWLQAAFYAHKPVDRSLQSFHCSHSNLPTLLSFSQCSYIFVQRWFDWINTCMYILL